MARADSAAIQAATHSWLENQFIMRILHLPTRAGYLQAAEAETANGTVGVTGWNPTMKDGFRQTVVYRS